MHIVTLVKIYIEIALLPFLEFVVASYIYMFSVGLVLSVLQMSWSMVNIYMILAALFQSGIQLEIGNQQLQQSWINQTIR